MTTLATITAAGIDWTGVEAYTTHAGKTKHVLTGIPSGTFWKTWAEIPKTERTLLRLEGFQLHADTLTVPRETRAGNAVRGAPATRTRKRWTAQIWINRRNEPWLRAAGLIPPVVLAEQETEHETADTVPF